MNLSLFQSTKKPLPISSPPQPNCQNTWLMASLESTGKGGAQNTVGRVGEPYLHWVNRHAHRHSLRVVATDDEYMPLNRPSDVTDVPVLLTAAESVFRPK
jgi:hypothetical protein